VQLGKRKKPLASFLFLGPTGTGKTETAKALAELFFQDESKMIRFDMSAFQTKQDIARLIGAVELNEPGLLTNAIRNNPYGVLLLDELEKAHKDLLNIFLTVLDEGYFTDSMGRRVDCKNLIIIATSNAGSELIYNALQKPDVNLKLLQTELITYLVSNHIYTPEFLNRFDGVVTYKSLDRPALLQIARGFFHQVANAYEDTQKVHLTITDSLLERLIDQSYHPEYGARNMQRIIKQEIEDKVAKLILSGAVNPGQTVRLE
jgi:ATP-dependent Clp protease ATP-binding subunit ClpA